MAKGDGSIINRGRNVWEVSISYGKDPITGKYRRITKTVHGTKRDAARIRDRMRQEKESGLTADGGKITFGQFADEWHAARVLSGELARTTLNREKTTIELLKRYIGDTKIRDITPQTVESLYSAILADKTAERGGYSGTTMHMHHVKLKQILDKAVRFDIITRNPCDRVDAPKVDTPNVHPIPLDMAANLLDCADAEFASALSELREKEARQDAWGVSEGRCKIMGLSAVSYPLAVRLDMVTGMRRGEVFAITWENVDFERHAVRVTQSITAYGELKPPKTRAGIRRISIDAETIRCLAEWKEAQCKLLTRLRIEQNGKTPVFCSGTGGFISLPSFSRWFKQFRERNSLHGARFHDIRHTQATQLIAHGVDVKTTQARLGHSDSTLTLNWYTHPLIENDEKAGAVIGGLFSRQLPQDTDFVAFKTA